jgi:DNA-3-methyladenine glycosylase
MPTLPRSFYQPSASMVAPALLGHWLIHESPNGICGGPIVETEAYVTNDPACHAAPGLTARNAVMFGRAGHAYVYLIYGLHYCVNVVCCGEGVAEAVLIRAIEPLFGEELMRKERPVKKVRELTNGPAKLCQALRIERNFNGVDLCQHNSVLHIAQNPKIKQFCRERGPMVTTTRIGITKAAALPLRFYLEKSEFVSNYVSKRGV